MRFRKFCGGIFFRFLLSYVVIFMISMALSFYAYYKNIGVVEKGIKEAGQSTLENCMTALDGRLNEMESYSTRLSYDHKVLSYAQEKSPYIDSTVLCSINALRESLTPATLTNQFIKDMYLYFFESDVVISPGGSYLGMNRYYGDFFSYSNYDAEGFKELLYSTTSFKTFYPNDNLSIHKNFSTTNERVGKGFLYVQPFPLSGKPKGQIVFSVSETEIKKLLSGAMNDWNADVYILDQNKDFIFTTDTMPEDQMQLCKSTLLNAKSYETSVLPEGEVILLRTTSSYNQWTYVMSIPVETISGKLSQVKLLMFFYLLLTMIVGIAAAIFFAFRNTNPIVNVVEMISKWKGTEEIQFAGARHPRHSNEMKYLTTSIQNLYESNINLSASLNRQLPLMRATFVERLFDGWFHDEEEISWFRSQLNFRQLRGKMIVLMLRFDLSDQKRDDTLINTINMVKSSCEKAFQTAFDTDVYYCDHGFDCRTMLFAVPESSPEEMMDSISAIAFAFHNHIFEEFGLRSYFVAGSFADHYLELPQSYQVAEECMDLVAPIQGRYIIWPNDLHTGEKSYYYPLQLETHLINATKTGDLKQVISLLDTIYQENFVRHTRSAAMVDCLIFEMKGTMIKLYNGMDGVMVETTLLDDILEFEQCHQAETLFRKIEAIFERLCTVNQENRKQKNTGLIYTIEAYVMEHYQDAQLNLNDMANRFGITASYLSQLFKENIGTNFSSYLEDLRIEKACDYLSEGLPINLVAEKAGYNSVYVFRNAFKRKKGVSPSNFRELIKDDNKSNG